MTNGKSLQAIPSKSCGGYALLYLKAKARGRTLQEFLNDLSNHNYVSNDHQVGQRIQQLIVGQEKSVVARIINVVVNKKVENEPLVCHCLSGSHANGPTVSFSYPVQYFGGGSFGMWQNRVYGKSLVRQPGLV